MPGIPNSLSGIPDSKIQDSRFHNQDFPRFRILQGKNFADPGSGYSYTGKSASFYRYLKLLKAAKRKGKKSKPWFDVTPGNRTRACTEAHAITNCANPFPLLAIFFSPFSQTENLFTGYCFLIISTVVQNFESVHEILWRAFKWNLPLQLNIYLHSTGPGARAPDCIIHLVSQNSNFQSVD